MSRPRVDRVPARPGLPRLVPSAAQWRLVVLVALVVFMVNGVAALFEGGPPGDATFWEATTVRSQNPYVLLYLVWPMLTIIVLSSQRGSLSDAHVVRRGSLSAAAAAEAVRGGAMGAAAGAGMLFGGMLLSLSWLGAGFSRAAFSERSMQGEGSPVLEAYGNGGVHPVVASFAPVIAMGLAVCCLTTASALAARRRPGLIRVIAALVIVLPPILFRAPSVEGRVAAVALLLPYRSAASGVPMWVVPSVTAAMVLVALTASMVLGRGRLVSTLWRSLVARWFVLALALVVMASFASTPGSSIAESALYGATPEGFSAIPWAVTLICWQGLGLVVLLRWSTWVLPRVPMLALRYGSAVGILARQARRDVVTVLIAVPALLGVSIVVSMLLGAAAPGGAEVLTLWVGGVASALSTVLLALIATWISRRDVAAAGVLVVLIVSTLPGLNPLWPVPIAIGGLGAWGRPGAAVTAAGLVVVYGVILFLCARLLPRMEIISR